MSIAIQPAFLSTRANAPILLNESSVDIKIDDIVVKSTSKTQLQLTPRSEVIVSAEVKHRRLVLDSGSIGKKVQLFYSHSKRPIVLIIRR
jgi:hypothetical protein